MNKRIRVLVTKPFFKGDINYIISRLHPLIELVFPSDYTHEGLYNAIDDSIEIFLGPVVDEKMLKLAQALKLIQIPWTGVETIDFNRIKKIPVKIYNSHSNAEIVAEYSLGLMFSIIKGIPYHDRELREGNWHRPVQNGSNSFTPPVRLNGKTVGFLGFGAIARAITKLLQGFDLTLIAIANEGKKPPPPPLSFLGKAREIERVLNGSDILFITLPLTDSTKNLIDIHHFEMMKSSAYLINISRGSIIKEEALYNALKDKMIAGAAIDTWYAYPSRKNPSSFPSIQFPFHELDNLVLSPHRAGFSKGMHPHLDDAIENLNRYAEGKPLLNKVSIEKGY